LGFLALVVLDVYATILHGRGRSGPMAEALNQDAWFMARQVAFSLNRPMVLAFYLAVSTGQWDTAHHAAPAERRRPEQRPKNVLRSMTS